MTGGEKARDSLFLSHSLWAVVWQWLHCFTKCCCSLLQLHISQSSSHRLLPLPETSASLIVTLTLLILLEALPSPLLLFSVCYLFPVWLGNSHLPYAMLVLSANTVQNAKCGVIKPTDRSEKMFTTFLTFSSWLPLCQYLIRAHHHHMELILAHPYKSLWNRLLIHRFSQPTNIQKVNSMSEGKKKPNSFTLLT